MIVEVVVALVAGGVVGAAVRMVVRPRRSLGGRIGPYLGVEPLPWWGADTVHGGAVVRLVAPSRHGVDLRPPLTRVVAARRDRWRSRVLEAGLPARTVDAVLRRHHRTILAGLLAGAATGLAAFGPGPAGLAIGGLIAIAAHTREPGRLARLRRARAAALEADAPRAAELLAVNLRAGHGIGEAARRVTDGRSGALAAEFGAIATAIATGVDAADAWAALARRVPDPGTARLARSLSASARTGGELAPVLLSLAADLRALRRHSVARRAVRRRTAMVAPLLLCIAPVMALFVGAALPSLVLGG